MAKRIILCLGIIVFVVLVVLVAGYYLLIQQGTPQLVPPIPTPLLTPSPTPSPEPITPTPKVSAELTINPHKQEVNSKLQELMVQYEDKLPLLAENPVIRLHQDKVEAEDDVILSGVRVRVWGEGRVEVEQGKPKIVVDTVRAGKMPLPLAFQQLITSRIPTFAILPIGIPMEVTSISVLEGKVVIEGIPKSGGSSAEQGCQGRAKDGQVS